MIERHTDTAFVAAQHPAFPVLPLEQYRIIRRMCDWSDLGIDNTDFHFAFRLHVLPQYFCRLQSLQSMNVGE